MTTEVVRTESGISGSVLKMVAVITMLIDHIAATIMVRHFLATGDWSLYTVYYAMRQIGRIAFPIYCFMLVEGLEKTRNKGKYLLRMMSFALISEIPFDLALTGKVLEFGYQNVFFTLTIALAAMMAMEKVEAKIENVRAQGATNAVIMVFAMVLAAILQTDYDWKGVICIIGMYLLRKNRLYELIAGYVMFLFLLGEWAALPAFILLAFYKGRKGFSCKWFFYGFYPVHLLVLYFVCVILGIASISAV